MGEQKTGQGKSSSSGAQRARGNSTKAIALALAGSALALGNSCFAADMQSGIKKYQAKQYQAALNDFKEVVKANPSDALCHYYMALCNQCLARIGEAKLEYKKVTEIGPPNLKAQAQSGLSQLEKVSVRTGGNSGSASTTATTDSTGGAAGAAGGNSPVATSGANGAGTYNPSMVKGGKDPSKDLAEAKKSLPAIKQVIMFYSDSSPGSAAMQDTWDEAKVKYKTIEFTRLNVADNSNAEMVAKYGVNAYPTTVMIDQQGKAVLNQPGPMIGEAFNSTLDGFLKKK